MFAAHLVVVQQFDVENKSTPGGDQARVATLPVGIAVPTHQIRALALAHLSNSLVPSVDMRVFRSARCSMCVQPGLHIYKFGIPRILARMHACLMF